MLLDVGLVRLVQTGLHLARRDCLLRIMAESNESGEALLSNVIPAQEAAALTAPIKPCSVVGGTNEDIFSSSGTSLLQMFARFTLVELEQLLHFGWPGSTLDPLNPSLRGSMKVSTRVHVVSTKIDLFTCIDLWAFTCLHLAKNCGPFLRRSLQQLIVLQLKFICFW